MRKILKDSTLYGINHKIEQHKSRNWHQISEIKYFQSFDGIYQVLMEFKISRKIEKV